MEIVERADGLRGLIGAIGANLAAIARSRLELFSLELQEEKIRLVQVLTWTLAGLFCAGMGFILLNATLVVLFWESAGLAVLAGLTAFYLVAAIGIGIGLKRHFSRNPLPFSETLRELRKDRECFRGKS